ncbi:MAG: CYTH domain-containing protein [Candidatus Micrarchaeales archaeon]|nr:CYTH domain-containing protein [Candidatus Micrarchaeales archaeon]
MDIEVELRCFLTKEKYNELLAFFSREGREVAEEEQETHYLDEQGALRIQQSTTHSKVWYKAGKLHDEQRQEIEVRVGREDFPELERLFKALGYKTHIKWIRKRKEFEWKGVSVMLDYTKGYGYILELEKKSNEAEKDRALVTLKERFAELGLQPSTKEEFDRKYKEYSENWENLISSG